MRDLALAVIYFTVSFFGIIGNVIVLYVLLRQRRGWSVTTTYLFNLALSDLLFLCIMPFWGHQYLNELNWAFGLGWCKVVGSVTSINMYASVFFLTAMSVDRYMAVVHATSVNVVRNSCIARWVCISVWSAALLLSLPRVLYQTLQPIYLSGPSTNTTLAGSPGLYRDTGDTTDTTAESLYSLAPTKDPNELMRLPCNFFIPVSSTKWIKMGTIQFIGAMIGFIVPMIVISICYARIVVTVKKKVISKKVRKDRVAKLAALVVLAFFFCWLPMQIMQLFSALGGWWKIKAFNFDKNLFHAVYPFMIALAYSNSCINPIVYAFTTTNFQENIKDICGSDKASRPYKMTLSPQPGKNGDGKTGYATKTEAINMYSPCAPRSNHQYTPAVQVHAEQNSPGDLRNQNHLENEKQNGAETFESQSFSYYSCPAVMQGLGKINCEQSGADSVAIHSTPLDNDAYDCIATDAV
uniref:type-1 angiotensin II receptor A n=1 Tax=Ciona intestinalis TaxID=7719 RepID=UPI000044C562|nr:type-1 angiotensin II receptor A [Ciona intestinalis]|eukprot:XP_002122270.1 type-1 angiotensin II receptor A [Ciona intestinalis]